ncbi:tetratricopeptide repeat protein [Parerythrobacter aestuarii]|uniref:tetratricopeptide repeat protein n=1 Tax=Parerythrobacter aestuarii TaxID=3020909 RepID=UPI0024DE3F0B|nr:tetratricopeptide repeat protein [Parerythrobacter aestuarii]
MSFRHTRLIAGAVMLGLVVPAVPAFAQDSSEEARIRKLEAEVRALQRRVFPGGDGRYFEPQITGQPNASTTQPSTSTTAVTDILARLDALEASLARLTGQVEVNSNSLRDLSARLVELESNGSVTTTGTSGSATNLLPAASGESSASTAVATPTPVPDPAPEQSGPSAERLAAVQAISKPQTDDAGDDEYSYGFRLWNAGFFSEAQQQLAMFVDEYPNHSRATYGRNLLGRAFLDDGKPREAAPWFLKNYQEDRNAARAPDSLLYLAESMIALGDTSRACIALVEFGETYPALASGRLQSQYEANRRKVTCN